MPIPKKRAGNVAHDKALQKFYRATYEAVVRHINFGQVCFFGGTRHVLGACRLLVGWGTDGGTDGSRHGMRALTQVKAILLASPGFVNSDFFAFMNNEVPCFFFRI